MLGLLGLARRAGRAAVGTRAVEEAARAGRLAALFVAADAAGNARRRLEGTLRRSRAPVFELADRARLGAAVGKGPVAVVGVTDPGIASRLSALAGEAGTERAAPRRSVGTGTGGGTKDEGPGKKDEGL